MPINKRNIFQRILFSFLLLASLISSGQDVLIDSLSKKLNIYHSLTPQEKIYLHTDKSFYIAGETIWFKIYEVDASTHKPVHINKVVYVELTDKENKIALHTKIAMDNSNGSGTINLPNSFTTGNYLIRAYTAWMKNFPSQFYFKKEITIINTLKRPNWKEFDEKESYDVHFFPEGGNLVNGIKSKIAFRVTDQYGRGVDCSGVVLDQNNEPVTKFHTLYFGMGNFEFTPTDGKIYHSIVNIDNAKELTASLPPIFSSGYVMNVTEKDSEHLTVRITTASVPASMLYLVIHTRQVTKLVLAKENKAGIVEFDIEKRIPGDGISHFTVFNGSGKPVCERLYFKQPEENPKLEISSNREQFNFRNRVDLDLSLQNTKGHSLKADISVSVHLLDSLQLPEHTDIVNYLLLTSDLSGKVESPDFYFDKNNLRLNEALDNLMLTQGWRRFKWDDVLAGKRPTISFIPDYEGQVITGRITNRRTGDPLVNRLVWLTIPGKKFHLSNALSNDNGEVNFVVKNVYGSSELILQTDTVEAESRIDILSPYSEETLKFELSHFSVSENYRNLLMAHSMNTQIEKAFQSTENQKYISNGSSDSSQFYVMPDAKYLLDDYTRFPTMEEVMREFVFKVRVRKDQDNFKFEVLNTPYKSYFDKEPLILMDGVPVFNADKIITFDPLKVKSIEVIARKYFYGNKVSYGIVSYHTYDGEPGTFELDPNSVIIEYEGLQLQREFYSPVYDSPVKIQSSIPDRRSVLLWYPSAETMDGKLHLTFYTSDISGKFEIKAEGLNADGIPFKAIKNITVTAQK